jgi:hypothetical protein
LIHGGLTPIESKLEKKLERSKRASSRAIETSQRAAKMLDPQYTLADAGLVPAGGVRSPAPSRPSTAATPQGSAGKRRDSSVGGRIDLDTLLDVKHVR